MDRVHTVVPPKEQELLTMVFGGAALPAKARRLPGQDDPHQLHLAALLLILLAKDPHLYTHSRRVRLLTHHLACGVLHLSQDEAMPMELAALVHDIGKLAILDEVLQKASPLTQAEFAHIKQHPALGAVILRQLGMPTQVTGVVYHHHEHWDGAGYPSGLQGEAIPLGARIVAVADAFEVMTSHRPYQTPRTPAQALEELRRCAGTQFDPFLVERFCTSLEADLPGTSLSEPGRYAGTNDDEARRALRKEKDC